MQKMFWTLLVAIFLVILFPLNCFGDVTTDDSVPKWETPLKIEIELEDLTPLSSKRNIETFCLNVLKEKSDNGHFSFYTGLTITRTWGDIIHDQEKLKSSAWGIGPICLMRDNLFLGSRASLTLDMSMGFIIYNQEFPANGTIYNFMWQIGPKFRYQLNNRLALNCGYKWMHVSNGRFPDEHNPAYNGSGFLISLSEAL
jgi:hypothetical protein